MHTPQPQNLKLPVDLAAQDVHGSGCKGSLAFFITAPVLFSIHRTLSDYTFLILLPFQIMFFQFPRMSLGRTHMDSLFVCLFSYRQVNLLY